MMTRPATTPRKRRQRHANGCWYVAGYPVATAGSPFIRKAAVSYLPGGRLTGDRKLVDAAWDEARRSGADMADPKAALAIVTGLFLSVGREVGGDIPQS